MKEAQIDTQDLDLKSPDEIGAMLNMIEYLLAQAHLVSPSAARHLGLARDALLAAQSASRKTVMPFRRIQ